MTSLAGRVRRAPGDVPSVAGLARELGVGRRRVDELFLRHFHVSAEDFLVEARVQRVRSELALTRRRLADVALDAGFEDSAELAAQLRARTGLSSRGCRSLSSSFRFSMGLPAGFRVGDTLAALGRDGDGLAERRRGHRFAKALVLVRRPALLTIHLGGGRARCGVDVAGVPSAREMLAAHDAARRLLGFHLDPGPFERATSRRPGLAALVRPRRGLRIPLTASVFEGLLWTVVGQQVNLSFAFACRTAVVELTGRRAPDGFLAHPEADAVARLEVRDLMRRKFSRRKAEYLIGAARAIVAGTLPAESLRDVSAVTAEAALLATRGLGPWSTQYVLMRSLGLADCVPVGDAGLVEALHRFFQLAERPGPGETLDLMAPFAPHRSLATFQLWKSLASPT